jgi:hypothetical protein
MTLEAQIAKVMADTGMEYIQAHRHVLQRQWLQSQPAPQKVYK